MTSFVTLVADIIRVYTSAQVPLPEPRAIALRQLEETIELCLACGASPADVHESMHKTLRHEHEKRPAAGYHERHVDTPEEIAGELADTTLLQGLLQRLAAVHDDEILTAAMAKVERLAKAQRDGTLRWTEDGRFYRTGTI